MTGKEIIKDLDKTVYIYVNETDVLVQTVIDLINRYEAEIERLNKEVDRLSQVVLCNTNVDEIKSEAIKELMENAEKELYIKQDEHRKHWEEYLKNHRGTKAYQDHEQAVDNWLRGYGEAVQDILSVNDNIVKEMVGEE